MPPTKLHLTSKPPRVTKDEIVWAGGNLNVETARELVSITKRRPWQGDLTTIHITAAHAVKEDVWNTLLKVLEEPPSHVQFHLYAPSTDSIPGTIKSRSHVTREGLAEFIPEDASRLVRLYESGDALAILREADRYTEVAETVRVLRSLWVYSIETGKIDAALLARHYSFKLRPGVSPRVTMKALLLSLAIRHRKRLASGQALSN